MAIGLRERIRWPGKVARKGGPERLVGDSVVASGKMIGEVIHKRDLRQQLHLLIEWSFTHGSRVILLRS